MRMHSLLGDLCGSSWTYMHWDSSVPPVGSVIPLVEAPSGHCSSSLHSLIPMGH